MLTDTSCSLQSHLDGAVVLQQSVPPHSAGPWMHSLGLQVWVEERVIVQTQCTLLPDAKGSHCAVGLPLSGGDKRQDSFPSALFRVFNVPQIT